MKKILRFLTVIWPWFLRRHLLGIFYGFEIHPTARIGWAWVFPEKLKMGAGSRIGQGTVIKGVESVILEENASIGRLNWITGEPKESESFRQSNRTPLLHLARESAITNRHLIDCTDSIRIGAFTIVAGFRSQLLTHSIDLPQNTQSCSPIQIGSHCFVGTGCVVLGGSRLPDFSVLGAGAVLNKPFESTHRLYGGVPAQELKTLDSDWKYFSRQSGYVS